MTLDGHLLVGALVALATAGVGSGLITWCGPLDRPRVRGLHAGVVATSGGLAIIAGVGAGVASWAAGRSGSPPGLSAALILACAMGMLGALDDLRDLGAKFKLALQGMAALSFAAFAARIEAIPMTGDVVVDVGPLVGALGTALWIIVVSNGLNFMDAQTAWRRAPSRSPAPRSALRRRRAALQTSRAVALIGTAAAAGFLPWNLSGRLFQGDAGALFSSVVLSCLAVLGAAKVGPGSVSLWIVPLALLPLLTDVLLTLLIRARRRQPLLEAHRDHLYQLWLQSTGKPHTSLAWRVYVIMAAYGGLAISFTWCSPLTQVVAFTAMVLASSAAWVMLRRRLEG